MKKTVPPAFMPVPEHCDRKSGKVGDVVVVDTVICHWSCDKYCDEYASFHKTQVRERKNAIRMKDALNVERPMLEI